MRFRRRYAPSASVDLVPMIDVVFQLVVFFMVSSTFVVTPGITLTLPESTTSEAVSMTNLVVSVVSENEVYLNKDRYSSLRDLEDALDSISDEQRQEISTVVIEGDQGVSYNLMIDVLDTLREAGFRGISLKTRDSQQSK